ncbi:MAG: hypothetical protein NT045_08005 [Candidatus Aureabacteria bacterium]|nr:hypothetical protein [Candidatus Auribacterota bacterium]
MPVLILAAAMLLCGASPADRTPVEGHTGPHSRPAARPTALPSRQQELSKRYEIRKATREKRVITGMGEHDVKSAWGWPEFTHPVQGVDTSTDRWTYRRGGEGFVDIYFQNGVVTHIIRGGRETP